MRSCRFAAEARHREVMRMMVINATESSSSWLWTEPGAGRAITPDVHLNAAVHVIFRHACTLYRACRRRSMDHGTVWCRINVHFQVTNGTVSLLYWYLDAAGRNHIRVRYRRHSATINPLTGTLKPHSIRPLYSNTVIGTVAVDGWTVTFGTARRGLGELLGPAQSRPCCTKYNNPPTNGKCTNFILFDVAL